MATETIGINGHAAKPVAASAGTWTRADSLAALLLFVGGLLIRLPFQTTILDSFDAVNYALALEHFDMRISQPQPPGYPLYVVLGRLFNLVLGDHRAALVWISMLAGALVVPAMYLAGHEIFNRRTGWIAALLTGLAPVVWYMSEIAAPYSLDLLASILVGVLCYRLIRTRGWQPLVLAAIAVGLAGALRLQTLIFLFPLLLYALFQREGSRRWLEVLVGGGVALALFAVFFIPAVYLSGGPGAFITSMIGVVPIFRDTTTLVRTTRWVRFATNFQTMLSYTLRTVGELSLPFLLVGGLTLAGSLQFWRSERLRFGLVWLLPSWVVYFLIWPGNIGTVLVSMAPLFLLAAAGLNYLVEKGGWIKRAAWFAFAGILFWNILVFAVLPEEPFGKAYRKFENHAALRDNVDRYANRLELMKDIPSQGSLVFSDNIRILQYYQPHFLTYSLPRFSKNDPNLVRGVLVSEQGSLQVRENFDTVDLIPVGTERLVFFDFPKDLSIPSSLALEQKTKQGISIFVLTIPAGESVLWTKDGLQRLPVEAAR